MMTSSDQRRAAAMTRLVAGELTVAEVAILLGRSERSVWRLRRRYVERGVEAIVHGNRGRPSPHRLAEGAPGAHRRAGDDGLRRRQRQLPRRAPGRARRDCHRPVLAPERGPRLTLVGGIDDVTGIVTGATFRDQEDVAGYLMVLRATVRPAGGALPRPGPDRH